MDLCTNVKPTGPLEPYQCNFPRRSGAATLLIKSGWDRNTQTEEAEGEEKGWGGGQAAEE